VSRLDPRERAPLGRTRLTVTRVGLGTAPLGGLFAEVSRGDALAAVDRAWREGVRFFDTAPLYGHGLAEQRLGEALRDRPRDEVTVSTKVGRLLRPDVPPEPGQPFRGVPPVNPTFDFSYDGVMRSVEESLRRLGLDRVDVLFIHDPDDHFADAMRGAYPALDRLRSEGVVGAIGAGMNQAEMLARFAREADFDCFLLAGRYTLLDQGGLAELLPLCLERGIAIVAGGVFNGGILAGPRAGAMFNYRPADAALVARAERMDEVCRRHGVTLKAAAIHFPFGHPAVTAALLGCRSAAEVEENVRAAATEVPEALWQELRAEGLLAEAVPAP
jgi:D-threo-aldose 1-dehydrogenase